MRENESSAAEAGTGKKAPFALMAVLAISCAAGGTIGGALIGPKLTGAVPAASQPSESKSSDQGKSKGSDHGTTSLFTLESLVVNPSGTAGTRFLILSLALDVSGSVDVLKNQEARLRDVLLGVLARKSVEELADIAQRDALKKELLEAIQSTVHGPTVREIYFPQYVLQ